MMMEIIKTIFIEILEIQRICLTEFNGDPEDNEEIIRQQLYQIAFEDEQLKKIFNKKLFRLYFPYQSEAVDDVM